MRAKRARLRTSTPALRIRPASTTTGSAGKTISPPTGRAAEQAIAANPTIVPGVRTNRAFPRRAVSYLASEAGIRQFLDVGTGLPSANNTHQVAQAVAPDSKVVYVDNDPIVLLHARALLTGTPQGATAYLDADVRDPGSVLVQAAETLDLAQPVALMLLAILQLIPDDANPHEIVQRLMDGLPAGSYLVITHPASDVLPDAMAEMQRRLNERQRVVTTFRPRPDVCRFFGGLWNSSGNRKPSNRHKPSSESVRWSSSSSVAP